jgi:hypothetical protein
MVSASPPLPAAGEGPGVRGPLPHFANDKHSVRAQLPPLRKGGPGGVAFHGLPTCRSHADKETTTAEDNERARLKSNRRGQQLTTDNCQLSTVHCLIQLRAPFSNLPTPIRPSFSRRQILEKNPRNPRE